MAKKINVILTKQVPNLGNKDEVVCVSAGYARNHLIPKKLAVLATKETLKKQEADQKRQETEKDIEVSLLQPVLNRVSNAGVEFVVSANENGQLFGSINERTIKKALREKFALDLHDTQIKLEGTKNVIRHLGQYQAEVTFTKLPNKPQASFPISIKALKR